MQSCVVSCIPVPNAVPGIDMHDHLAFIFRLYFFPGRNDQDIIHIELVKIFFPVIDPVLVLCLGFFYRPSPTST